METSVARMGTLTLSQQGLANSLEDVNLQDYCHSICVTNINMNRTIHISIYKAPVLSQWHFNKTTNRM